MSAILKTLSREHRLFERLIESLRRAVELKGEDARAAIAEALKILLPALERHDAIEDSLFAGAGRTEAEERRAVELVEAQHEALEGVRKDIEAVLESEESTRRLKDLAELLAGRLEWHFRTEESLLWPVLAKRPSRSLSQSLERRAARGVQELEAAVPRLAAAASERAPWR